MSTVTKIACNIKINGKEISVSEGTVILEACNQNEVPVTNLCYNRKLMPFAACRTCMVETVVDGKKGGITSWAISESAAGWIKTKIRGSE